jgi:hypothetical protein
MSELSLQELDAQFSELLPEREALGALSHISFHHFNPCHPKQHHHCDPKPCEPKQVHPCPPKDPCPPPQQPCPPPHHHCPPPSDPCSTKPIYHDGGHGGGHDGGYGGGRDGGYGGGRNWAQA